MESDVCRVAVHAPGGQVDLELPNTVAVALLLPPLCDIVDGALGDASPCATARPRQLCTPGLPPLDASKTLPENGIRDGDTLVLIAVAAPRRLPPPIDTAEQLVRSTASTAPWTTAESRAAALTVTVILAGVTGILAVPGPPGVSHLLLATSAAGTAAAIAARVTRGRQLLFAVPACGCALVVAATLCTSALGGTAHHTGLLLVTVSSAVLVGAGRLALQLCGLLTSADRDLDPALDQVGQTPPANECLTALVLAAAGTSTFGVFLTLARPTWADCALAAAVTAALLLRARAQRVPPRTALLIAGTVCAAATLVAIRHLNPALAPWLCAVATNAAAGALWFGYRIAHRRVSPVARHVATTAECAVLAAVIPLACWGSGLYETLRSVRLP